MALEVNSVCKFVPSFSGVNHLPVKCPQQLIVRLVPPSWYVSSYSLARAYLEIDLIQLYECQDLSCAHPAAIAEGQFYGTSHLGLLDLVAFKEAFGAEKLRVLAKDLLESHHSRHIPTHSTLQACYYAIHQTRCMG